MAKGASKSRSLRVAVWPQISHHVLAITFYSLETNIRYISIIAGVELQNSELDKWSITK